MRWLAFLLASCAFSASLADLQETAKKLQAERPNPPGSRGESPLLTEFKHQLIDWVESQIPADISDPQGLAINLNDQLQRAGLMCSVARCDDDLLGYLDGVEIKKLDTGWYVLITAIGVLCGYDESIYVYEIQDGRRFRRFASEQNLYGENKYKPQNVVDLKLGPADAHGERLLLTVGVLPWCVSSWHEVYPRVFRVGREQKTLIDGAHGVYLGGAYPAGRIDEEGALVEFSAESFDNRVHNRRYVFHFKIDGDQIRRIQPIALRPFDFVDEWLTRPWSEIAEWSDPSSAKWHNQLHGVFATGEFRRVVPCADRPGFWQIAVQFENRILDFLVEDLGQYRYRMADVSDARQPGCPGQTPVGTLDRSPTLFPN